MPGAGTKTDITTGKQTREGVFLGLRRALKARWWRRQLLWRAFRKRRELSVLRDRTKSIARGDILLFSTVRNESQRLPYFLDHHRALGVSQFLFVDNDSDDGTREFLLDQPDVSLWQTAHSYKQSRFGVDWLNWLQMRYGSGHWCLTLDADEILIYPKHDTQNLRALTGWLDAQGARRLRTIMLDMYPKGRISGQQYHAGQNPTEVLSWFDPDGYYPLYQPGLRNEVLIGGPRGRLFFQDAIKKSPTLTKMPLVKWHWRYAFVSSTHSILPRDLNYLPDDDDAGLVSGAILHTKFLPEIVERSREEKQRKQHFAYSAQYDDYYDSLISAPDFWHENSQRYRDWRQLTELGLMQGESWG